MLQNVCKIVVYGFLFIVNAVAQQKIYGNKAGFFDSEWTSNDFKFLMIEIVTIFVAILMQYTDKKESNPTFKTVMLTVFLAIVFVFFVYEYAIQEEMPMIYAMIIAFLSGAFGLQIMLELKSQIKNIVNALRIWILKR